MAEQKRTRSSVSTEVAVMGKIEAMLDELPPAVRTRVLAWLQDKYKPAQFATGTTMHKLIEEAMRDQQTVARQGEELQRKLAEVSQPTPLQSS